MRTSTLIWFYLSHSHDYWSSVLFGPLHCIHCFCLLWFFSVAVLKPKYPLSSVIMMCGFILLFIHFRCGLIVYYFWNSLPRSVIRYFPQHFYILFTPWSGSDAFKFLALLIIILSVFLVILFCAVIACYIFVVYSVV